MYVWGIRSLTSSSLVLERCGSLQHIYLYQALHQELHRLLQCSRQFHSVTVESSPPPPSRPSY